VERLRREIDSYGGAIQPVIAGGRARTSAEARELLARIVPRRELVIGVTDEVQSLNRAAFVQQQRAIAETHESTERAVWIRLGLSFLASFGIALVAAGYAGRLENRLRRQRELEAQHSRDLQRLSARLVRAQEEERRTIARELHDEVGQVLTAVRVELTLLQNRLDGASSRPLEDALEVTESALQSVRDLSHLLHPALLDDLGLAAAVDWYLQSYGKRHEVRVALNQDGMTERVDPQIEIAAYRIVQEALTNAARHAGARACTVTLRRLPALLSVVVEDDGCGFDAEGAARTGARAGLGLVGIRERAAELGGTVRIESAPGAGTRLQADLPLRVPREAADAADGARAPAPPAIAPEALGG
jgi:signal transduction histidine kinase